MGSTRIHRILEEVGSIAFPGVFDTLSAKLAHRAGFPMAFVSGYSVSATAIGEPDMGLLTQTEMIDRARGIGLILPIPVVFGADKERYAPAERFGVGSGEPLPRPSRGTAALSSLLRRGDSTMTDDQITELLFVREEPVRADLAMVFGAANEEDLARRTRQGVRLYREGYVPRLLVTGGGILALARPEAVRMADLSRRLGVPDADLLVESRSNTTVANARYSLDLLRERGLLEGLATVLLVSSEWHMRRVLLTVRATFPGGIRLVCCPTTEGCTRENWTASEACRREVIRESELLTAFHGPIARLKP